jgi:hypothetical protein
VVEGGLGERRVGGFGLLERGLDGVLDAGAHLGLKRVVQQIVRAKIARKDLERVVVARFFTLAFGSVPPIVIVR